MAALSEEEARRLAERFDRRLRKLDKATARALIAELRKAQEQVMAKILAGATDTDTLPGDMWRLQQLLVNIDDTINGLAASMGQVITNLPVQATALADQFAAKALQSRLTFTFAQVNVGALRTLQEYDLGLIRNVTDQLRADIRSQIMQGVIQGESIPKISRRLSKGTALEAGTFPKVEKRATVIARTETLRAFNQAALEQYRVAGVVRVKWLTGRDERVCDYCGPLDGKVFPIDDLPWGAPPIHPQCRCTASPSIAATKQEGDDLNIIAVQNAQIEHKRYAEYQERRRKRKGAA